MLTADDLHRLARERGIFATPTRAGERGPVLLGSICDQHNHQTHEDLRRLEDGGEIMLVAGDVPAASESLRDRGLNRALIAPFMVGGGWVYSILVEAVPVTGEGLTEEEIREASRWAADREARHACRLATRAAYNDSRPALPYTEWLAARARIAAAINRRRGVIVDGGTP